MAFLRSRLPLILGLLLAACGGASAVEEESAASFFRTDRERMQYLAGLYGRTSQGLA